MFIKCLFLGGGLKLIYNSFFVLFNVKDNKDTQRSSEIILKQLLSFIVVAESWWGGGGIRESNIQNEQQIEW